MNAEFKELKFGTSGLRDTVKNMTDLECYVNARGFIAYLEDSGEFKKGDTVALAGDRRPSTYKIKRAVAAAICDSGGIVNDQGQVPSPALANYAICNNMAGIMVTGSHIPADRNGIKFTKRTGEILKSDESGILENVRKERIKVYAVEDSIFDKKGAFKADFKSKFNQLLRAECHTGESGQLYIDRYKCAFGNEFFPEGTKIFLYQHSAVGRDIAKEIFESLGAEIFAPDIEINNEPLRSNQFVPVDTESVTEKTLGIFKRVLVDNDLDIGITLDGDADRPLLVYREYEAGKPTDNVKYITGDILGLLAILGLQNLNIKVDAVCVPVSANDAIIKICQEKGIELTLTKIGSPYVIAAMNDSIRSHSDDSGWTVFSWESNGGFLTGTDLTIGDKTLKALPTRDAVLPLLSVIHLIKKSGKNVSQFLKTLPSRFTHADRKRRFPMERAKAIISYLTPKDLNDPDELEKIKKRIEALFLEDDGFGKVENVNYTDGIRILFDNGEISHLRPSGNAPEFRNYAIADSQDRAREIVRIGIEKVIPKLVEITCPSCGDCRP
jgi:phosphomannomutase